MLISFYSCATASATVGGGGPSTAEAALEAARQAVRQAEAERLQRQSAAASRATQLKLEAAAARAAARELAKLAAEDERLLASRCSSSRAATEPLALSKKGAEAGFDGSPTRGLRFAPGALCGAHSLLAASHKQPLSVNIAGNLMCGLTRDISSPRHR